VVALSAVNILLITDRRTDVRQKHRLMSPPIRGGDINNGLPHITARPILVYWHIYVLSSDNSAVDCLGWL